ncbi:ABC transporter ATP-binding protein [Pyruvatibacter sp.]|uniref:ABC transporter ATP-binding protein n=1 Tax=Pyruvatibacter sp. TaxID=1981328 RepID=UPI0032EF1E77
MADAEPTLSVDGVSYRYGARQALSDVSFDVQRGRVFALLGPNGAGKSTIVRAICGRVRPGKGSVRVVGLNPAKSRAAQAAIGLVPQDIALYPYLTVAENMSVFGRLAGLGGDVLSGAVAAAVASTGLEGRLTQRVETLSGGYKRRANIASALLHSPKLLVLDEPTVGVDPDARNSINGVLRSLAADGMSILITTHDLDQAAAVATDVGIIADGRIVQTGVPDVLVATRFGTDRELVLLLAEPVTPDVDAKLRALDFSSQDGGRQWRGRLAVGDVDVEHLTGELSAIGVQVRETRVRKPGLDSLYAELTGDGARESEVC